MAYVKKVNIKGQDYWYLFHTIRQSNKFLKKSRYLGKELPKNLEEIKQEFLNELHAPKEKSEKEKLIESLTPSERKVFPILKEENELSKIAEISRLQQIEVLRALGWLEAKNLIKINKEEKEIINLDKNGLIYLKKGFPEKQFLKLRSKDTKASHFLKMMFFVSVIFCRLSQRFSSHINDYVSRALSTPTRIRKVRATT